MPILTFLTVRAEKILKEPGLWKRSFQKNGDVLDLRLSKEGIGDITTLHSEVVSTLEKALRASRFKPAVCNGDPMEAWYVNAITFRLLEDKKNAAEDAAMRITNDMVQPQLLKKVELNLEEFKN